ncbi:MAG: phospho-N-acetylmuramoyl-pentapeptide-transferase [Planctomycetota bacterium]|nr:phospho-N-acetylmuramoyl-pentapeptide-transferase [Planctomycetota bacterium]
MLYYLGQFGDQITVLNVFRYITFRTAGATMTAILFVFLFGPAIIATLRLRQHGGQPIREDGPQAHLLSKKGTPTMGGLMILSGLVVTILLWGNLSSPYVWIVLFVTIGFGAVGFYDDYLKVTKASANNGFSGRIRLLIEALIAVVACIALAYVGTPDLSTALTFPFLKEAVLNLGWFFVPIAAFVIVGAGNAVNLTDGLDGLAGGCALAATAAYTGVALVTGDPALAARAGVVHVPGAEALVVPLAALAGGLTGFLVYNRHPARVFMGDAGSLPLGGVLGLVAVLTRQELLLVIIGGVFVAEALSVMAQVASFKLTGKRVLRCAPLHHHYEFQGWKETKIVGRFHAAALALAALGLVGVGLGAW